MNKMEALADAFMKYSAYQDVESEAYIARNPGAVKAHTDRHEKTAKGYRVFKSLADGYTALVFDLETKCKGKSNCGLKESSTLSELVFVMGLGEVMVRYILKYLRRVLNDPNLDENTPIGWFME